jgi:hypothetical protein
MGIHPRRRRVAAKVWTLSRWSLRYTLLVIGMFVLVDCGSELTLPENLQIRSNIHITATPDEIFQIDVPIVNATPVRSAPAQLELRFEFDTDTNGGFLNCTEFSMPCPLPQTCARTITVDVPGMERGAIWHTGPISISPDPGPCSCRKGHCSGGATLKLHGLPVQRVGRCNTVALYSWHEDSQDSVVGLTYDKHECQDAIP